MKPLLLAVLLALALPAAPALSEEAAANVTLDGLSLSADRLQISPKEGYVFALADLFPLHDRLKKEPKRLARIAKALADGPVLAKAPDAKAVKVVLVEFPQNDEYGQPMWSSVQELARYEGVRGKDGFTLKPAKKEAKGKPKPAAGAAKK